jgi:hypothetical protein
MQPRDSFFRAATLPRIAILVAAAVLTTAQVFADAPLPLNDNQSPPYQGVWEGFAGAKGQIDAYSQWLNRKALWVTVTPYWGTNRWLGIEAWVGGLFIEKFYGPWIAEVSGRRSVVCLPMLAVDHNYVSTLAQGAKGEYNSHFTLMAQNLVKTGLGNSVICMGLFNTDVPWKVENAADAANFVLYWQQIVTTMRAVPGAEKLQFDWVGANAKTSYPIDAAYPGDAYVDFVGMVLFDRCFDKSIYPIPANATDAETLARRQKAWNTYYYPAAENGLEAWRAVARAHKKPFSIPGWCLDADHYEDETLSTGGDNTFFIQQMYNFIQDPANNVYFASYIDACWDCTKLCPIKGQETSIYPESAALFQKLFALPTTGQPANSP